MKYLKIILVFLIGYLVFSCNESITDNNINNENNNSNITLNGVPDSILQKANDFVISKVGLQFFKTYITIDSSFTQYSPPDSFCIAHPASCSDFLREPHYYFGYRIYIPETEYVDENIDFVMDTTGNIVSSREPWGIPECPNNDCYGNFPNIDKDSVYIIAKNYGLEEGLKEWSYSFHFFGGPLMNYIWEVRNTLFESNLDSLGFVSGGRGILIKSNDGTIFQEFQWGVIP